MDSPYQIDVIGTIKTHTKLVNMTLNGSSLGAMLVQGMIEVVMHTPIWLKIELLRQLNYQFSIWQTFQCAKLIVSLKISKKKQTAGIMYLVLLPDCWVMVVMRSQFCCQCDTARVSVSLGFKLQCWPAPLGRKIWIWIYLPPYYAVWIRAKIQIEYH